MKNKYEKDDYEVGYGKPPTGTRFKSGTSGNPTGRPKGSLNIGVIFHRELRRRVDIHEGGQQKKASMATVMAKRLVTNAAKGHFGAAKLIMHIDEDAMRRAERKESAEQKRKDNLISNKYESCIPEENEERIYQLLTKSGLRIVPIEESVLELKSCDPSSESDVD